MTILSVSEAQQQLGALVRQVAAGRRAVITGPDGHSTAVLVSAGELADLEDELAFAQHDAEKAAGTFGSVPQAEARRRLGLPVE
jgi:PHD/YefM family antitoxin component YafN of YafNO toxin-antitoxin module